MIYILLILIVIRLSYWLFFFTKLAKYKPVHSNNDVSVSIIVCVKNNIEGIKNLLPKLLKQNYSNYEVILIDDFSTDGLQEYVQSIGESNLIYHKCSRDLPGKKQALSEGIHKANNDWILSTDSDCMPSSLNWIKEMTSTIKEKTEIVLGYGPLNTDNSLSSLLSKYETGYIAMQYLSYSLLGKSYMGVGRNLLFNKSSFLNANPYQDNKDIASGDDDFLVNKIAKKDNVEICIHPNAFCYSNPPSNFGKYFNQKTRHISTASYFQNGVKQMLGIFAVTHISIYLIVLLNFIFNWFSISNGFALLIFMWSIMFLIQLPIFYKLKESKSLFSLPISDFLLAMFYLLLSPMSFKRNNIKWN